MGVHHQITDDSSDSNEMAKSHMHPQVLQGGANITGHQLLVIGWQKTKLHPM
jgi:hypothetical protein